MLAILRGREHFPGGSREKLREVCEGFESILYPEDVAGNAQMPQPGISQAAEVQEKFRQERTTRNFPKAMTVKPAAHRPWQSMMRAPSARAILATPAASTGWHEPAGAAYAPAAPPAAAKPGISTAGYSRVAAASPQNSPGFRPKAMPGILAMERRCAMPPNRTITRSSCQSQPGGGCPAGSLRSQRPWPRLLRQPAAAVRFRGPARSAKPAQEEKKHNARKRL